MTLRCSECETTITLSRGEYDLLEVQCACDARRIRVKAALPDSWSE